MQNCYKVHVCIVSSIFSTDRTRTPTRVTSNTFPNRLNQTDAHHRTPKCNAHIGGIDLPGAASGEFDVAQRRQNVCQRTRTRSSHELEHDAQIAGDERHAHGGENQRGREDQVAIGVEVFGGKVVFCHDFSADEAFQWKCGEHVQAKAESSDVDHEVVVGEVVQNIALCLASKYQVPCEGHDETRNHRYGCAPVCDFCESIHGRCSQRAVDEQAVVMTHESERDDANGLKDARIDDETGFDRPLQIVRC